MQLTDRLPDVCNNTPLTRQVHWRISSCAFRHFWDGWHFLGGCHVWEVSQVISPTDPSRALKKKLLAEQIRLRGSSCDDCHFWYGCTFWGEPGFAPNGLPAGCFKKAPLTEQFQLARLGARSRRVNEIPDVSLRRRIVNKSPNSRGAR